MGLSVSGRDVAPSAHRRRLFSTHFSAAVFAAALCLPLLAGCDGSAPASEAKDVPPALTVSTVAASKQAIDRNIIVTGSVVAWQDLSIGTEISGLKVVAVPVEEGDVVKKGQLLAQIDNTVISAQFRHAEGAVREAQANLKFAESENVRAKELVARGNISAQSAQDRETKLLSAAAKLSMAEAQRDEMKARLVATSIVAPVDGYISKRSILIGDVVAAGREAFRMVRDSRLELDAQIPETDLGLVRVGQKARITQENMPTVTATVRAIAPTVDPKTRLGTVHVELPQGSPLKPGMFARAEILTSQAVAVAVPDAAVIWRDGKAGVFVIGPRNHVILRTVGAGARQNGWVQITEGLEPGEHVITTGAGFLHDGDVVAVQTAGNASTAKE
ncbi:MAG: efflux RND transporter periplasmic adaptor subunit [Rhodospirillaceae bacterium]|nr:efflux RND transporter periplasmic adaptor subunit [Rhodospirillaceae bacterium]